MTIIKTTSDTRPELALDDESPKFSLALPEIWLTLPQDMSQFSDEELDAMKVEWRLEKYG
jgi:hypothetical protein